MNIKYYAGSKFADENEIASEDIQEFTTYTKAYWQSDRSLDKVELYDSGNIVRVDYYNVDNNQQIQTSHQQNYPGIQFAIWVDLVSLRAYTWKFASSFNSSGELTGFSKILANNNQQELMQIDLDKTQKVLLITKYYWEEENGLRYVFEYDSNGTLSSDFDVLYGDNASFPTIREYLVDAQFYDNGFNLPATLTDTTIPPNP